MAKKEATEINGASRLPDLKKPAESMGIIIEPIRPTIIQVPIVGITPLVVQAWTDKARRQMLDKQMKKASKAREAKDPQADFMASRYLSTEGWDGVPAGGFKGCIVNACRAVDGLPMTLAKRMVFVRSQGMTAKGQGLVRIYANPRMIATGTLLETGAPEMHEGMVRIDNGGTADIRFRAMFKEWSAVLEIEYLASVISAEQVCNLVELAGYIEGICEHRPGAPKSCTGDWGRFKISSRQEE